MMCWVMTRLSNLAKVPIFFLPETKYAFLIQNRQHVHDTLQMAQKSAEQFSISVT